MRWYTVYGPGGRVLRSGLSGGENINAQSPRSGEDVVEGRADDRRHYVVRGRISDRPAMPVRLHGLRVEFPEGAEITVRGPARPSIGAGVADFAGAPPGLYGVTISKWPYRDERVSIRVEG